MANKNMGRGRVAGQQHVGSGPDRVDEQDLASDIQGRNKLQGNDQTAVQNERLRMAEERREPLEDADLPDRRANRETAGRTKRGT